MGAPTSLLVAVRRNAIANIYAQVVNVCAQLVTIPALLHSWGGERLGWWLVLSSIPALLTYGDFGVGTIAGNSVGLADAEGAGKRAADALTTGRVANIAVTLLATFVLAVVVAAALTFDHTLGMPRDSFVLTSLLLGLGGVASIAIGYQVAVLRGLERWAPAIYSTTTVRIIECAGVLVVAHSTKSLVTAAAVPLLARLGNFGALLVLIRRATSGFRHAGEFDAALLRSWIKPSITFAIMPISQSALLNLPLVFLGGAAGPAAVSLFAAARTATRVPLQVANVIGTALAGPAMRMARQEGAHAASRLVLKANAIVMVIATALGVGVVAVSPLIFTVWTGGRLSPDKQVLIWLAVAGLAAAAWNVPSNFLAALSSHSRFYVCYFLVAIAGLLIISASAGSLVAVAACLAIVEIAGVALSIKAMKKVSMPGDASP